MDLLQFTHCFFHFSYKTQQEIWGPAGPTAEETRRLFETDQLSRRTLKSGNAHSFDEAMNEFSRLSEWAANAQVRVLRPAQYPEAMITYIPPERLPPLLYVRGSDLPRETECVSVVGTRYPSPLGREAGENFSAFFTMQNIRIVSGLAKGIDTIAHRSNLRLGTVAVLGSGVDAIYPTENSRLADEILAAGGSLVSPFPLDQVPLPRNFPQRNEIIAALSAGTTVIEGNATSGAAVTGRQALAMGKCVATLTQDFRSGFGRGAILLQQAGATLVCREEEALQAIFARFGGFENECVPLRAGKRSRTFSFREFWSASGAEIAQAMVLLEESITAGRVERLGPDSFVLKPKPASNARQ